MYKTGAKISIIDIIVIGGDELFHPERGQGGP